LRAGKLDRRIAIQRKTTSQLPSGELVESWTTLATRWASIGPLNVDEAPGQETLVAKERVEFRVRYESQFANLSPVDRIVCPASDAALSTVPTRSIYDIAGAVDTLGRHEQMQIVAFRRSDVLT
jgi:head-tail adaptor